MPVEWVPAELLHCAAAWKLMHAFRVRPPLHFADITARCGAFEKCPRSPVRRADCRAAAQQRLPHMCMAAHMQAAISCCLLCGKLPSPSLQSGACAQLLGCVRCRQQAWHRAPRGSECARVAPCWVTGNSMLQVSDVLTKPAYTDPCTGVLAPCWISDLTDCIAAALCQGSMHDSPTPQEEPELAQIALLACDSRTLFPCRVPTIDGDKELNIRPGTQASDRLRMRGYGVPHLQQPGRGDQYVHVDVSQQASACACLG